MLDTHLDREHSRGWANVRSLGGRGDGQMDCTAPINDAIGMCRNVFLPPGRYLHRGIVARDGLVLRGAGTAATRLVYMGSGTAVNMAAITRGVFRDIGLELNDPAATGIAVAGQHNVIDNFYITGPSAFALRVTGDGVNQSFTTHVTRGEVNGFTGVGLQVDHAVDAYVSNVHLFAPQASVTAQPLVIETGTSGLYLSRVVTGWGKNALLVKHSTPGAGAYNQAPIYLFFDQFVGDASAGGDAWLFDASLGTNLVAAHFTNSWAASAGWGAAAIVTPGANGVHISGGREIFLGSGTRILRCSGNGVLFDNASVSDVTLDGARILSNNQDNAADQHGIYVGAAVPRIAVLNTLSGNVNVAGGAQRYGMRILLVNADQMRISGCDFGQNVTGPILNANTGAFIVGALLPTSYTGAQGSTQFVSTLSPPADSGAAQTGRLCQGSGVPNNANGNNGDVYFRTDTPGVANQRLYVKSAGAWAGIL